MALIDESALFSDATFVGRVSAAVKSVVSNVLQENTSGNIATDSKRRSLATKYINSTTERDEIIAAFVRMAVANQAIENNADNPTAITDAQVQTAVNNAVNRIAGINVNNPNI